MLTPKIHELTLDHISALRFLEDHTATLSYKDGLHGMSDLLTARVADPNGLWRSSFAPAPGALMSASLGYAELPPLHCGLFEVDQPSFSVGSGVDVCTFSAVSAILNEDLRKMRSEASEQLTVAQMVAKIAGRNGLTLRGAPPATMLERETQRRQSDIEFLKRLAEDHDCIFSIKGDQLVFMPITDLELQAPSLFLDLEAERVLDATHQEVGRILSAEGSFNASGAYRSAHIHYFDGPKGKELEYRLNAEGVGSREVLEIDERADSVSHAQSLCRSALSNANRGYKVLSLEMTGNPFAIAGICVQAGVGFGKYAGKYLLWESSHEISGDSYKTKIELKWCQE